MLTPHLVEALLAGLVLNDEACEAYSELGELRLRARGPGGVVPFQWALCVADFPLVRGLVRHTAHALLDLVDAIDDGAEAGDLDGCPLWHTLAHLPQWFLWPPDPDDDVVDIALLLERDEEHGGDWMRLLETLHIAGSLEWQWAIQRCRSMQSYEKIHGLDLRDQLPWDDHGPPEAGQEPQKRATRCRPES